MTTKIESYKCEFCGKLHPSKMQATSCEVKCHNRKMESQKQQRKYETKVEDRLTEAREISKYHTGIKLLVKNKLYGSARVLCRHEAKFLWDCGTSSGWENVYTQMIRVHDENYTPEY